MSATTVAAGDGYRDISRRLQNCDQIVPLLRDINADFMAGLNHRYDEGEEIADLVHARARFIDDLLVAVWDHCGLPLEQALCLIAVGGYGRGELHPHSDIDLLLLVQPALRDQYQQALETFITLLWDIKLDIGHSVRTIEQCVQAASEEITVATNLMESRLLAGEAAML